MKKTYFSIPLILLITFLFAFSLPVDAGSKKSSKSQPSKKAPTKVQTTKPVKVDVKSASPNSVRLEAGGKPETVTLKGSNLNKVTSAKVLMNNRPVREVEIKLGPPSAKSRKVELKAKVNTRPGSNYKLRLIAAGQTLDISTKLIRIEVIKPKVVKKIPVKPVPAQVPRQPAKVLPLKPEISKPTEPSLKMAVKPFKKTVVKSSSARYLQLEAGGNEETVTLKGSNLNKVTSAKLMLNNRPVIDVEVMLGPPTATSRRVTLKAQSKAKPICCYALRLVAGKETIDVPTHLMSLKVTAPKLAKAPAKGEKSPPGSTGKPVAATGAPQLAPLGLIPQPDLIITILTTDRNGYRVGDNWSATAVVKNIGDDDSGTVQVTGRLGRRLIITKGGTNINTSSDVYPVGQVGNIAPGESVTLTSSSRPIALANDALKGIIVVPIKGIDASPENWVPGIPDHSLIFLRAEVHTLPQIEERERREDNNIALTTFRYPVGPEDANYNPAESADDDNDGWTVAQGDCDDNNPTTYPGGLEIPNDYIDNDCKGGDYTPYSYTNPPPGWAIGYGTDPDGDSDNDGYIRINLPLGSGDDCNDGNANIHPNAPELMNGADDNCNLQVDEGVYVTGDLDYDGYEVSQGDCNDYNGAQHPGAAEVDDGLDNNCNSLVDEGFRTPDWVITAFNVERTFEAAAAPGISFSIQVENIGDDMGPQAEALVAEYVQIRNQAGQGLVSGSSGFLPYTYFPNVALAATVACNSTNLIAALPTEPALFGEANTGNNTRQFSLPALAHPDYIAHRPGLTYYNSDQRLVIYNLINSESGDCDIHDIFPTIQVRTIVQHNGEVVYDQVNYALLPGGAIGTLFGSVTIDIADRIRRHDLVRVEVIVDPDNQITGDPGNNNQSVTTYRYKTPALSANYFEVLSKE